MTTEHLIARGQTLSLLAIISLPTEFCRRKERGRGKEKGERVGQGRNPAAPDPFITQICHSGGLMEI